eukprot:218088_1
MNSATYNISQLREENQNDAIKMYQQRVEQLKKRNDELKKKHNGLKEDFQYNYQLLRERDEELDKLDKEIEKKNEVILSLTKTIQNYKQQTQTEKSLKIKSEQLLNKSTQHIEIIKKEHEIKLNDIKFEYSQKLESIEKQNKQQITQIQQLRELVERLKSQNQTEKKCNQDLSKKYESKLDDLVDKLSNVQEEFEKEKHTNTTRIEEYIKTIEEKNEYCINLEKNMNNLNSNLSCKQSECNDLYFRLKERDKQINEIKLELNSSCSHNIQTENVLNIKDTKIDRLETDLKKMYENQYVINNDDKQTIAPIYDLYAVSTHNGSQCSEQTEKNKMCKCCAAYVLNTQTDRWYYFQDSAVKMAKESDIISSSSYILFYRKRNGQKQANNDEQNMNTEKNRNEIQSKVQLNEQKEEFECIKCKRAISEKDWTNNVKQLPDEKWQHIICCDESKDNDEKQMQNDDRKKDKIMSGPVKQLNKFLIDIGFEQYFESFVKNGCDISYIEDFDDETLMNDIGIKSKLQRKKFLRETVVFKNEMDQFNKILLDNNISVVISKKLKKHGIVTVHILCNEVKRKVDLKNLFEISNDLQCVLLWNIIESQLNPEIHMEENEGAVNEGIMDTMYH